MPLKSIAYFISSHGFGHAARSAAVMQAIAEYDPSIQFEIFTAVPAWFFQDSLSAPFNYHHLLTDFGLAQKTPFESDLGDTLRNLNAFYPITQPRLAEISETIRQFDCRLIICDIAPMGLLVATGGAFLILFFYRLLGGYWFAEGETSLHRHTRRVRRASRR